MMDLSRRTVLEGCAGAALAGLFPGAASATPLREIEEIFGPKRMAKVVAIWNGEPAGDLPWSLDEFNTSHIRLDRLLDATGRFQLAPAYRRGLTLFLNGVPAVEFLMEVGKHRSGVERSTLCMAARFGLTPQGARFAMVFNTTRDYRIRLFVEGTSGATGWEKGSIPLLPPDPILMKV
ncbi:hypothetical protein [Rhodovulum sp. PH10]|uniref:hypothetical protein n=1 Tax=Rhodovulum sp. PH10 TaxID=1187851 RepID=UPI00031C54DE|nr:hypothetical protein [Rhodovulum sp. PH10]